MIERSEIDANAVEIKSRVYTVRAMKYGDKTLFGANDILSACGIKAPGKWMERNAKHRPDVTTIRLPYPVRAGNSYRRVEMIFVTAAVGKRLVKITACPVETKKWLMEEVFTYKPDDDGYEDLFDTEKAQRDEWGEGAGRRQEPGMRPIPGYLDIGPEELSKRIDSILVELLEIRRCVSSGRTAG
ncbi:hypothetical protein [Flintibacter porci]|uniref:hypothetical protein n=1 Tax=Flintibacter porci TaxID=3342383 RepID=UPI003F8B73F5